MACNHEEDEDPMEDDAFCDFLKHLRPEMDEDYSLDVFLADVGDFYWEEDDDEDDEHFIS